MPFKKQSEIRKYKAKRNSVRARSMLNSAAYFKIALNRSLIHTGRCMKAVCFLYPLLLFLSFNQFAVGQTTAFKNVNLIPMTVDKVVPGQTVIISEGKIKKIGPSRNISIPEESTVIDGAGKYLMPGLADMHTHVNQKLFEYPFFNLFLANGVTTIRDLAQGSPPSILHYRREVESSKRLGPNMLVAYTVWGKEKNIAKLIESQHSLSYDCLKVNSYLSPADFNSVMRETKKLKWYTLGHIPEMVQLDGVLAGGMNELSHIEELMIFELLDIDWSKVTNSNSFENQFIEAFHTATKLMLNASAEEIRAAYDEKVRKAVQKFKGKDIVLTTTIIIHEDIMNKLLDIDKIKSAPQAKYIASKFWKDISEGNDKHQKMVVKGEERAWFFVYELQNMLLRELKKNNVFLVLGTDVGPTYLSLVPGFSVLDELRLLTENGLSPFEAIATATKNAGEVAYQMTGKNNFGTIEVGKRADFILLEKNPLADVDNIRHPLGVMVGGRWLSREKLQNLLTAKSTNIEDLLAETYSTGGYEAALTRYHQITSNNFLNEYYYSSATLNNIGYKLLSDGHIDEALKVFHLNVQEYPEDWNTFDSYGEALMKAGMKELAIKNYEQACKLDPSQESPRNILQELKKQ